MLREAEGQVGPIERRPRAPSLGGKHTGKDNLTLGKTLKEERPPLHLSYHYARTE